MPSRPVQSGARRNTRKTTASICGAKGPHGWWSTHHWSLGRIGDLLETKNDRTSWCAPSFDLDIASSQAKPLWTERTRLAAHIFGAQPQEMRLQSPALVAPCAKHPKGECCGSRYRPRPAQRPDHERARRSCGASLRRSARLREIRRTHRIHATPAHATPDTLCDSC